MNDIVAESSGAAAHPRRLAGARRRRAWRMCAPPWQAIFGQDQVIERDAGDAAGGRARPADRRAGLAKTKLVETLGIVLGMDWKRIQFTPDLMPTDIIGTEVLEEGADHAQLQARTAGVHAAADGRRTTALSPHAVGAAAGDAGAACDGGGTAL